MTIERVMEGLPLLALLPRLRRYATALVGDPGAADDLVHDTLERFHEQGARAGQRGDLHVQLLALMHRVHEHSTAYGRNTVRQANITWGGRALQALPLAQRKVILLVVLEDMPYEQVARVLAIPLDAAIDLLSEARARLHAVMSGPGALKVVR